MIDFLHNRKNSIISEYIPIIDRAMLFCLKNKITEDSIGRVFDIDGESYVLTQMNMAAINIVFMPMSTNTNNGQMLVFNFANDECMNYKIEQQ